MDSSPKQARIKAVEGLPPLRDIIDQYELYAQKSLGQNFLLDINITDKIVREAMNRDHRTWEDVHALEVGPGPGGLTRSLLKSTCDKVTAIEYDRRAVDALQSLKGASQGDCEVIQGDALDIDLTTISGTPRVIVANLPYNIATPLLIGWLKQIRADKNSYQSMALMFQKEVAERIVAKVNTKAYGRLGVISQWLCDVSILYELPASAFTPPPKVKSAIVHFVPKALPDNAPTFKDVERVTAAAFNQRRKMVRSSLKDYRDVIKALNLNPEHRAENIDVHDFVSIAAFKA